MTPRRAPGAPAPQPNHSEPPRAGDDDSTSQPAGGSRRQEVRRLRHRLLKMILERHEQRQARQGMGLLARDAG